MDKVTLAQKMCDELQYLVVTSFGSCDGVCIEIERIPASWDSEAIEAHIFGDDESIGQLGYKPSEIDWACSKKLSIVMR